MPFVANACSVLETDASRTLQCRARGVLRLHTPLRDLLEIDPKLILSAAKYTLFGLTMVYFQTKCLP